MAATTDLTEAALLAACRAEPADPARQSAYVDFLLGAGRAADATLRQVLLDPADDAARLRHADALGAAAGTVPCGNCTGVGLLWETDTITRQRLSRSCGACSGTGAVPDGRAARAELIRVQVELAAISAAYPIPLRDYPTAEFRRRLDLERRERELWAAFGKPYERAKAFGLPANWLAFLPSETEGVAAGYAPSDGDAVVRRGFVDEVRAPLAVLLGGPEGSCPGSPYRSDDEPARPCNNGRAVVGFGRYGNPVHGGRCKVCSGTGRTPGVGATLFAAHPVTRVVATDKGPSEWAAGVRSDDREWVWERSMADQPNPGQFTYLGSSPYHPLQPDDHAVLPPDLFDAMAGESGGCYFVIGKHSNKRYDSEAAAHAALSGAVAAALRAGAGLPPLAGG